MPYSAAQWRPLIKQESARYAGTPGGAPPWQVVEGMVDLESGGDPNNVTAVGNGDVAVGLGQITTRGLEYDLYRKRFPHGPTDLTDPQTNMRIMVLGLDYRQEMGVTAEKRGQPAALKNWFVTAAAYLGAGSNEGINTNADRLGTTGFTYVARVKKYMRDVLKLSDTQIDAITGGSNIGQDLEPGTGVPYDNPISYVGDAASGLGTTLLEGFRRALPAIAGLLLLAIGILMVAKS